ncbi:MAG: response regulator [Pseudobdellovibrionaceae bacterium]
MKTIFFLDDSSEFLSLVKLLIERKCDCQTVTSSSYDQALQNEGPILDSDLAFLDINLGDESHSGLDVYRWLREKGYQKPVYFLTGHGKNSPDVQAAEALGQQVKVLTKPIPNKELMDLIGRTA